MKKRILALLLAAAMCLSLAACGDKDGSTAENTPDGNGAGGNSGTISETTMAEDLGYGYLSEYQNMDLSLSWANSTSVANGKIYMMGEIYDDTTGMSETVLNVVDLQTGEVSKAVAPTTGEIENGYEYIQRMAVCPDGESYWVIINRYIYEDNYFDDGGVEAVPIPYEEEAPEPAEGEPVEEGAPVEEGTPVEEGSPVEEGDPDVERPGDGEPGEIVPSEETPVEEGDPDAERPGEGSPEEEPPEDAPIEGENEGENTLAAGAEEYSLDLLSGDTGDYQISLLSEAATEEPMVAEEPMVEDWDDESWVEPEDVYLARRCSMDGEVLAELDITEIMHSEDYSYPEYMSVDTSGNLMVVTDMGKILKIDQQGNMVNQAEIANCNWIMAAGNSGNGNVVLCYYDMEYNNIFCTYNGETVSDPITLDGISTNGNISIYSSDGNQVMVSDGKNLYSLDTETLAVAPLLNWVDSDIYCGNITAVAGGQNDTVYVVLCKYQRGSGNYSYELATMTKTPADQIPERTILTMGALYIDSTIEESVVDFNRKSQDYRIHIVDYSQYNTEDDYEAGMKQMNYDIISGNCPDLISLDSTTNVSKYVSKGVLASITDLINNDSSFSMDRFVAGPLKAYEQDGVIYGIPLMFNVISMDASARLVGDLERWDLNQMKQVIAELPEEASVMAYYTSSDFLQYMVSMNMGTFVDYAKASCSFDSDEFKSLLEVASKLPAEINYDNEEEMWSYDVNQLMQEGRILMNQSYLYGAYAVKERYSTYTRENGIVNIGVPTGTGNGGLIQVDTGLAISASCAAKEGAWEFIKSMLTDEAQSEYWGFPVTRTAFDSAMQEVMEESYYIDENGEKVVYEDYTYIGDTQYALKPLTEAQVEEFKSYIEGCGIYGIYDYDILEIISEEAASYFAGDKSVDEVASLIQNRVSIYLGENS